MLVSRISPAPRSTPSRAHATASRPVGVRPPATKTSQPSAVAVRCSPLGVDREHDALRAEDRSASSSISSGRATAAELTRTLSAPASSTAWASATRADAAADRERDEDVVGGAPRQLDDRVAALVGRGDVEEDELVGALGVVALGQLDRVAGVAQVDEVRALDDAAGVDVQARDHALEVHGQARPSAAERVVRFDDREAVLVERLADDHAAEVDLAQRGERRARSSSAPMPPE